VALDPLDESALVRILVEPKNAIIKQYEKLFSQDKVELVFTQDALAAVASKALKQKTGARGLRTIIEENLLDVMFDIPSQDTVRQVTINREVIEGTRPPVLATRNERQRPLERSGTKELEESA
jgi:ATP-dependent Clp protease ATP-binding subunit ClpX